MLSFSSGLLANTDNVSDMNSMFNGCKDVVSIDLGNLNTTNLLIITNMFRTCEALETLNITGLYTGNVSNFTSVFNGCTKLNIDVSFFDISSLTNATNMMLGSAFGDDNYDDLLESWNAQPHNNSVTLHAGTAKYTAAADRADLIADLWTITDGGPV